MLTVETKRTIDAARDVLVGKVPDPKAQVEQITTALIYKFMHDLDQESVALGGQAKYFSGDYQKFAWSSLLDTRLSGEARLDLYVQAVTSLERNPNLPQLFRDIFKGAFLPYNDPQTLTLFLKEINKFRYDHSEELGNAFEYLLSVLGSQGDAGQFRTPRHIIDFMVEVIDPHKYETILDPACGTAGFLISAFKHIRKHNSSNFKPDGSHKDALGESAPELILADSALYSGDRLTPDERKKLTENIQGYDISPDMVRLSLVNLYLHGFPNPRIQEYDTLTSEKNWDESFDVILANPPFMTPKGGIRPHRRFQVQARRSEVLFVDYILEHLNPNGRAAVIVPEGIIFKSENAYKSLRRLLLDDGLYAVVSLPPGVFNPYSGVKTSILFFDMQLGKRAAELLFVKIEQDGFDLGAQRRRIDRNDLPEALCVLRAWQRGEKMESPLALWAEKARVAADGDYNLSAERYRPVQVRLNQKWPLVNLEDLCNSILSGGTPSTKNEEFWRGDIPWITSADIYGVKEARPRKFITEKAIKESATNLIPKGNIIIVTRVGLGKVFRNNFDVCISQDSQGLIIKKQSVDSEFLVYVLLREVQKFKQKSQGTTIQGVTKKQLEQIKIPLPPLEVQRDIVEQIQVKQDAIDAARALIASLEKERRFFARELQNMPNLQWHKIGDVCDLMTGGTPSSSKNEYYQNGRIKWIVSGDIHKMEIFDCEGRITELGMQNSNAKYLPKDSVLIALNGQGKTRGTVALLRTEATCNQSIVSINPKDRNFLLSEYLFIFLYSIYQEIRELTGDKQRSGLNMSIISNIKIPIPDIQKQKMLVNQMYDDFELLKSHQKLIEKMENKIEQIIKMIC